MRIRLHGTPADNAATLAALACVLTIHAVSRPYRDRPPSTLERQYLDVGVSERWLAHVCADDIEPPGD